MTLTPVRVLLVEDDDLDVRGVKRAFRKAKLTNEIIVASEGIAALEVLRGGNGEPPLAPPLVILLDLNLPRMNGHEFLDAMRSDPALHHHVVFVLTTSDAERDRKGAYDHHVAGYITKNRVGRDFMRLVELLDPYWTVVQLEA